MKVLLIYPPRRADTYFFPPLSLLYVANAIRAIGHEAQIIDIPYLLEKFPKKFGLLNNSLFDYIAQQEFDVLGLGGVVSTYFFYDNFVKRIRKAKKEVPIVVGGSVGVPIKDVWLKHAPVDFLVEGDGETPIQRLLNYIEGKCDIRNVPGLYYLKDGKYESNLPEVIADLDLIPFLSYDEIDYEYYIDELTKWVEDIIPDRNSGNVGKLRLLPLLTSRGCPFSCNFCFHFNKTYRYHSTKYMIDYLKFLKQKYNINCLYIIDDLFICNRQRTIELCDAIQKTNLSLYFVAGGGKPSLVTLEMLQSMKKAGFIRFSYGIESGSQKMLDVMKKRTTVEQNLNAIKLTKKVGIPVTANMVVGMPGENAQTLEETKSFLINTNLNTKQFYFAWATAYPGTALFEFMKEKNLVSDTREYLLKVGSIGNYIYNFSELPLRILRKKVTNMHKDIDIVYYYRNKQYLKCAVTYSKKIFKNAISNIKEMLLFLVGKKMELKLRSFETYLIAFLKKAGFGEQKRSEKISAIEIEKWVAYLKNMNEL